MCGSEKSGVTGFGGKERENIDESRLMEVIQALERLSRLRTAATNSSVYARQKKREAAIKRKDVWLSDGRFMEEIQRLAAHGKFEGSEILQRLAERCQIARDGLGPIEQEVIETEQEWEGHTWVLRRAEEEFHFDFQYEFEVADSVQAKSVISNQSAESQDGFVLQHSREFGADTEPSLSSAPLPAGFGGKDSTFGRHSEIDSRTGQLKDLRNTTQPVVDISDQYFYPLASQISDSDSGFGDIDEKLAAIEFGEVVQIPPEVRRTHPSNNEFYTHLVTDFDSRRDRINKWLESTVLLSHFEGTTLFNVLKQKLDLENRSVPSNWAQLVIAYWEFDGAAVVPESDHKQNMEA